MDDLTEWKHARLQGRTAAALWGLQKVENHLARCDEQSSAWRIKYSGTRDQKLGMCEGALGMMSGAKVPGEWPSRKPVAGDQP